MITLEIVQKIWDLIQLPSTPQSQVEARELDSIKGPYGHPLVTIDAYGRRHLLLPAPKFSNLTQDKFSSGIHVISNQWQDADQLKDYVDVVCLKPHLNGLFDMILLDILQIYPQHPDHPDKACLIVLDRWRELLSSEKGGLPDKSTLIGLWGELQLLLKLTGHNRKAVTAWRGPFGGRYDFYIGTTAVEVKTSTQRKGEVVSIHGPDQLEAPENGDLYLSLTKIEETPSTGENISDLVNKLFALGCSRVNLLKALNNVGLSAELIPECNDLRFRLIEWRLYHVDDQFPKITSESFADSRVPNGIVDIIYKIDLSAQPPYPLSEDSAEQLLKQFANSIR